MKKKIACLMAVIALAFTLSNLTSNIGAKGSPVAKATSKVILAEISDPLIDPKPHVISPTSPIGV